MDDATALQLRFPSFPSVRQSKSRRHVTIHQNALHLWSRSGMNTTFLKIFRRLVQKGNLTLILSSGERAILGDGSGVPVTVRTMDEEAEKAILHDPGLRFGEMYVEGRIVIDEGNIFDLISMVKANGLEKAATISNTATALLHVAEQQIKSRLPVNRNKHNVAHHYDLDGKLFVLFLDQDCQYSCAYFDPPGINLDEAQTAK
jgi:cyclopropane-fatty-acyl-phospholipid synthase